MKKTLLDNPIILGDMEDIYYRNYDWSKFDCKTVYITGSYGMLASYIVLFFIYLHEKHNINVTIIAQGRNEEKARFRFGDYFDCDYFRFTNEDISAGECRLVSCADYVIHAAGPANPRFYDTYPVEVIEPNIIGTYNLLKHCNKDNLKGFLFLSTCDVYGEVEDCEHITEETIGRVDPLAPHSCYNESKRMAETMLASFNREFGIRTVSARIGHTYGPTMDLENDPRVFASFIKDAVRSDDITLHSDGMAKRAFCYLSDAVAAYMLLLLCGNPGEAYNVTNTEQMISIRDLAYIISELPANRVNVVFKNRQENDSYLQDTVNKHNRPLEDKIINLGWSHHVDVKEGFSRTYRFFTEDLS